MGAASGTSPAAHPEGAGRQADSVPGLRLQDALHEPRVTTLVYCERCDRVLDSYEDDDQLQEATDLCIGCMTEEEWDAEQAEQ